MYCPRCGHQTISDELRFCSYCGFKLGVIKAALAESEVVAAPASSDTSTLVRESRQRDMNIGVILMFVSAMFASLMAGSTGEGLGRYGGGIILGILYLAIIVLSRPITKGIHKLLSWEEPGTNVTTSQKGMRFGATLMFLCTVMSAIGSLLLFGRMRTPELFTGLALAFAFLLLLSHQLMRGLRYLVQDEKVSVSLSIETSARTERLAPQFDVPSLPPGQSAAIPIFGTQKVTTAEMVAPSSVTEHTTNLLENR